LGRLHVGLLDTAIRLDLAQQFVQLVERLKHRLQPVCARHKFPIDECFDVRSCDGEPVPDIMDEIVDPGVAGHGFLDILYPTPNTVTMKCGLEASASILCRRLAM